MARAFARLVLQHPGKLRRFARGARVVWRARFCRPKPHARSRHPRRARRGSSSFGSLTFAANNFAGHRRICSRHLLLFSLFALDSTKLLCMMWRRSQHVWTLAIGVVLYPGGDFDIDCRSDMEGRVHRTVLRFAARVTLTVSALRHHQGNVIMLFLPAKISHIGENGLHHVCRRKMKMTIERLQNAFFPKLISRFVERLRSTIGIERENVPRKQFALSNGTIPFRKQPQYRSG